MKLCEVENVGLDVIVGFGTYFVFGCKDINVREHIDVWQSQL